jgi:hypothetical protein
MDLNIDAQDAQISTTRSSGYINVYLSGVEEKDLLSSENFQAIGIGRFIGEFGAESTLDFLKDNYPELFFTNTDIAELITLDTFFDSKRESEIKEYVKHNYDWFDE